MDSINLNRKSRTHIMRLRCDKLVNILPSDFLSWPVFSAPRPDHADPGPAHVAQAPRVNVYDIEDDDMDYYDSDEWDEYEEDGNDMDVDDVEGEEQDMETAKDYFP